MVDPVERDTFSADSFKASEKAKANKEFADLLDGLDLTPHSAKQDIVSLEELMKKHDVNDFSGPPLKDCVIRFDFTNMLKAFEDGFEGSFEDEEGNVIIYDRDSEMLLIDTEVATYPVNLNYRFIKQMFTKRKNTIDNNKVIDLINKGHILHFEVEIKKETITGTFEKISQTPYVEVSPNNTNMVPSAIALRALLNGTWTLE